MKIDLIMPKYVRIGAHDIEIAMVDQEEFVDPDQVGEYSARYNRIKITVDAVMERQQEVFFHEVVEAWNTCCGLELPHSKIDAIGECLYEFLLFNKVVA